MATYLQTEFNSFHEKVKLYDKEDNKELRDKRDMLAEELRTYFKKKAENEGTSKITFSLENQGSYSMGTGIKPLEDCDYDIDVMVLLNISKDDYTPVEVKKWVYEALDKHNRTVEYKKPCVRVQYFKDGKEAFHVDLALYSNQNDNGKIYLSKGKPTSATEEKKWEVSEPKLLKDKINNKFDDTDDRLQMKRVIRYLKRWKDFKFNSTGNGKPTGIALTALAYDLFQTEINRNSFNSSVELRDIVALRKLVSSIIGEFSWFSDTISVNLPVEPYNDLFEKMSVNQQKILKEKLEKLKSALEKAESEPDPHEASKILIKQLGDDFPEVEKDKSAQKRALAFPGKSESA
ncbi:MAG: nucleotidyltransferase [bacterium]|nr:nucleotidyltransferase [bacterium]